MNTALKDPVDIDTNRYMAEQTALMEQQNFREDVLEALDVVRSKIEKFDFTAISCFPIRVELDNIKATLLDAVAEFDPT